MNDTFRSVRRAWLTTVLLCLAGCSATSVKERTLRQLMERKAATLGGWEGRVVDGNPLLATIEMSTGMLVSPADAFTVTSQPGPNETLNILFRYDPKEMPSGEHSGLSVGSAVPITDDGYFLTASHCLGSEPQSLVALADVAGAWRMVESPFRVVWRSRDEEQLDLALLHAPVVPYHTFALAGTGSFEHGDPVAVAGWSGIAKGKPLAGKSAGFIRSISPLLGNPPGPVWRVVLHTAPLHLGDSGGPLVDENGRLIGIHNVLKFWGASAYLFPRSLLGYRGEAIAPDRGWLRSLIAADRKRR